MEPTLKSFKFVGKVLPDGHLSLPEEAAKETGKEFEITMKQVDDIHRMVSLYLEGKMDKQGSIRDIVLPSLEIEEEIKTAFGTNDVDAVLNSLRK